MGFLGPEKGEIGQDKEEQDRRGFDREGRGMTRVRHVSYRQSKSRDGRKGRTRHSEG